MHRQFCSLTTAQLAENLYATAPCITRFLLIEYNYPWDEKPLETSSLIPQSVKEFLDSNLVSGAFSRIFLIRNQQRTQEVIRVYLVNNQPGNAFTKELTIGSYGDLLNINFSQEFADPTNRITDPMYLVCTHGKVDMCCSKFGLPIFKQLVELGANVWQCTHVTGDRFAPNVVVAPYGHYYGHLHLDEIQAFYRSTQTNELYFPKYRGNCYYSKPAQAAEYFLRKHLINFRIDSLELLTIDVRTEHTQAFGFYYREADTFFTLLIEIGWSNPIYLMNCKATEKKPVEVFRQLLLTAASQLPTKAQPSTYRYSQLA